jgi:hypothetical protein
MFCDIDYQPLTKLVNKPFKNPNKRIPFLIEKTGKLIQHRVFDKYLTYMPDRVLTASRHP